MLWRYEDSGPWPGEINMRRDTEMAAELTYGEGRPSIRFYAWNPYAISIGWNQSLDDVDVEKAQAAGLDIVRRPTGGRAILHAEELTYCVAMPALGRGVQQAYEHISRALIEGLRRLGIDAAVERSQPNFADLYRESTGMACFSSAGRYEIKCGGRKLVGSAQRRYHRPDGTEVVLQHGSILIGPEHKRLVEFLRVPSDEYRDRLRWLLDEQTTDLQSLLCRAVSFGEVAGALKEGFQRVWNIRFEPARSPVMEESL